MESCIEYRERISALLDGQLPEAERQALLAHLAECPACQAELDDQLAIQAALTSLEAQAPAGFADAVMARVREAAQEQPGKKVIPFPHWRQWTAAAACCALVLLGALGVRMGPGSGAETYDLAPADADGAVVYSASPAPESRIAADSSCEAPAMLAALPAEGGDQTEEAQAPCTLTTASDLARQWVQDTPDIEKTGEVWSLTREQLTELRALLDSAGADYVCTPADSGWHLVLEP